MAPQRGATLGTKVYLATLGTKVSPVAYRLQSLRGWAGVLNRSQFLGLFFTLFLFPF